MGNGRGQSREESTWIEARDLVQSSIWGQGSWGIVEVGMIVAVKGDGKLAKCGWLGKEEPLRGPLGWDNEVDGAVASERAMGMACSGISLG